MRMRGRGDWRARHPHVLSKRQAGKHWGAVRTGLPSPRPPVCAASSESEGVSPPSLPIGLCNLLLDHCVSAWVLESRGVGKSSPSGDCPAGSHGEVLPLSKYN